MKQASKRFFFEKKNQKIFILGALAVALAGCSSPDPTFYTLRVVPGEMMAGAHQIVEVRRPGLAGYLDRSDIVLKNTGYTLHLNSQHRWGEPLGDMIGRVLTQDLAQRLPGDEVYSESGAISADPQVRVEVDIQNFDEDEAGDVVLNANVAVEQGFSHHPLAARHVSLRATPDGTGAAGLAATMSGLLGQLADRVAQEVK